MQDRLTFRSVRATPQTKISVLGQSDEIVEYKADVKPKTTWTQDGAGLHITAYRAQRLYTDRSWPDPVVLKMTKRSEPALEPPRVSTLRAEWNTATRSEVLHGMLGSAGDVDQVEVGFQYRVKKDGTDLSERTEPWTLYRYLRGPAPATFNLS